MEARTAEWTLVQLTGVPYGGTWKGWWAALNQDGEVFSYGEWGTCWESVVYWLNRRPPRGAAHGEHGPGWRGALPGVSEPEPAADRPLWGPRSANAARTRSAL